MFFGGSGAVLSSCGVPTAAWPAHTTSVCRCSSRSKESITMSTSVALRHPYEQRPITAAKAKARWRSPQSNGELMTEKQILGFKPAPRLE